LLLATRLRPSARLVAISALVYSLLVGLIGLAPSMGVALGLLLAAGGLSIVYSATSNTLLQLEAREEYRGRVLALYMLLFAGSTPIGSAVTGLVSDRWDIRVALGINGIVCVLVCFWPACMREWRGGALNGLRGPQPPPAAT